MKESDEFIEDIKSGHVKELEAAKVKAQMELQNINALN